MTETRQKDKATIKIPRQLYNRLRSLIEGTGFDSVTDFVVYVLRDVASYEVSDDRAALSKEELEMVRKRLHSLGYL
jgi:Arc/MetJ-type ribon-helix-helix transcriptional regulator